MSLIKFYSYLSARKVFILDILIAGIIDAIADINNENIQINAIDDIFISLGNFSKKYTSEGKISKLKKLDKKILTFSIFNAKNTPKNIPVKVAKKPIVNPVKKNDFFIELLLRPNVFKIAISLVLFFISIVNPEIILNAATIKIKVNIINITFLSTFKALKKDLLKSDQE